MDRVSGLPDELLCHILSFLTTTKEAALTSILSKRWRDLFALVPNLAIDDSEFRYPEEGKRERNGVLESFMDFVDRVLALQGDSPLNKVSLKCKTGVHSDRVDDWICNVLARGVSDLELCICLEDSYWLSQEGFESEKLVKLKIGRRINLDWFTEGIYLPMLKTLILDLVELSGDKLEMLLPAFPALEEFHMTNIKRLDSNQTVSSASLKILRIKSCGSSGTFSFDTPSLEQLTYSDIIAEDYPLVNFQSITEARMDVLVTRDDDDVAIRLANVANLMTGLRNVQRLYLTSTSLLVLSICCESFPVFNNLKLLSFRSEKDWNWDTVPYLLKSCPHLETLIIMGLRHKVTDTCGDVCDCISREEKGRSLRSCPVKRLEIHGFRGTVREINMIRHFLDYFPCLKEIEIITEDVGFPTQLEVTDVAELKAQLMELHDKSLTCNVFIGVCESLYMKLTAI